MANTYNQQRPIATSDSLHKIGLGILSASIIVLLFKDESKTTALKWLAFLGALMVFASLFVGFDKSSNLATPPIGDGTPCIVNKNGGYMNGVYKNGVCITN